MLMTREQIKEHLQIGEFTLRGLMDRGTIPFLRINNTIIRFDSEKVDAALTQNCEGRAYVGKTRSKQTIAVAKQNLKKASAIILKERRALIKSRKSQPEKP